MQPFSGTICLDEAQRFYAHCHTSSIELCGEYPSYLLIFDAEQEDENGLPTLLYQQDVRLVKSIESILSKIKETYT